MPDITPTLVHRARIKLRRAMDRGEPADDLIPVPHDGRHLYLCRDPRKVESVDTVIERKTLFHLGPRR